MTVHDELRVVLRLLDDARGREKELRRYGQTLRWWQADRGRVACQIEQERAHIARLTVEASRLLNRITEETKRGIAEARLAREAAEAAWATGRRVVRRGG